MALVRYDAPTYAEVLRTKSCRPGVLAFRDEMAHRLSGNPGWDHSPALNGCYNRRPVRGSASSWSTHAVGRGLDLGIRMDQNGLNLGNFLFLTLLAPENSFPLSIQQIIWNHTLCRPGESPRQYKPTSTDPTASHRNHLHIEFNRWGAERNTREWVAGILG